METRSESDMLSRAIEHHRAGRLEQAEAGYGDVLSTSPRHADAIHLLGVVAHQRQRHGRAVELIQNAIELKRSYAPYHCNLGAAYRALGQLDEAVACYRQATQLDPQWANPYYNLGNALKDLGQIDDAIGAYRNAIARNPQNAEAHNNLGDALKQAGSLEQAIESHRRAIAIRPDFPEAHFNLGNALKRRGSLDESAKSYRRALHLRPEYVDAHVNLGFVLEEQGQFAEAIASYDRAIELDPNCADGRFNCALALLRIGDFAHGWTEYEWRPARRTMSNPFGVAEWKGERLQDATILVRGEQGIGDEIMYASCLPELLERCPNCIVECEPRLVTLFQRSFPAIQVRSRAAGAIGEADDDRLELQPADRALPLASLPRFLRPSLKAFPRQTRYLVTHSLSVAKWRSRYASLGDGPKVGISWRGGRDEHVRRQRSTTLHQWAELLATVGTHFINLQHGTSSDELAAANQCGVCLHHWNDADPLRDLDDFAAQIAALDLVISVDNSTVHMAGALGTETWVLLPFAADWRWLIDRADSPWYCSVRLFRQVHAGEWQQVFANIAQELRQRVAMDRRATSHSCVGVQ